MEGVTLGTCIKWSSGLMSAGEIGGGGGPSAEAGLYAVRA